MRAPLLGLLQSSFRSPSESVVESAVGVLIPALTLLIRQRTLSSSCGVMRGADGFSTPFSPPLDDPFLFSLAIIGNSVFNTTNNSTPSLFHQGQTFSVCTFRSVVFSLQAEGACFSFVLDQMLEARPCVEQLVLLRVLEEGTAKQMSLEGLARGR